jgi:hypothetical protein
MSYTNLPSKPPLKILANKNPTPLLKEKWGSKLPYHTFTQSKVNGELISGEMIAK